MTRRRKSDGEKRSQVVIGAAGVVGVEGLHSFNMYLFYEKSWFDPVPQTRSSESELLTFELKLTL